MLRLYTYIHTQVHTYIHTNAHCRTKDKGQKLKEVRQQQQFIQAVEDVEQWIREVEQQLSSEDLGKDLTSVNNLLKKHIVSIVVSISYIRSYNTFRRLL